MAELPDASPPLRHEAVGGRSRGRRRRLRIAAGALLLAAIQCAPSAHAGVYENREAFFASRPGALFRQDDVFAPTPFIAPGDRDRLTYYWEGKSGQLAHRVVARGAQLSLDGMRFDLGRAATVAGEPATTPDFAAGARFFLGSQYACLELNVGEAAGAAEPSGLAAPADATMPAGRPRTQVYLLQLQPANARRAFRLPGLFASCTGIWRSVQNEITIVHARYRFQTGQVQPVGLTLSSFRLRSQGFAPEGKPVQAEFVGPPNSGRFSIPD